MTPELAKALRSLMDAMGNKPQRPTRATTWTWEEFEAYLRAPNLQPGQQRPALSNTTVRNTLRYLRALTNHPIAPVDLWPPSEDAWLAHIRTRTAVERAPETVLEMPRRALNHLVTGFLGENWPSLRKRFWRVEWGNNVGLPVHILRCGTVKDMVWARRIGARSVDSSSWAQNATYEYITAAREQQHLTAPRVDPQSKIAEATA